MLRVGYGMKIPSTKPAMMINQEGILVKAMISKVAITVSTGCVLCAIGPNIDMAAAMVSPQLAACMP